MPVFIEVLILLSQRHMILLADVDLGSFGGTYRPHVIFEGLSAVVNGAMSHKHETGVGRMALTLAAGPIAMGLHIMKRITFRPHLTMGLAFYRRGFKLPTGQTIPIRSQAYIV